MCEWWVIPHWPGSTSATALPYNECLWPRSFVEHVMVTFVFIGYAPSPFITSFPIIRLPLSQPAPPPVYPYPHFCPHQLCQSVLLASANSPRPQPTCFPFWGASLAGQRAYVVCSLARILQKLWQESSGSGKTAAHFFVALLPTQGAAYASRYV